MKYEIHYGKADVKVYRTYAAPLHGVTPIPESPFAGRLTWKLSCSQPACRRW